MLKQEPKPEGKQSMKTLKTMKRLLQGRDHSPQHVTAILPHALVVAAFMFCAGGTQARPRPPLPPYPESTLASWRFDNPGLAAGATAPVMFMHDVSLVESWSGYALSMEGKEPKLFVVPAVDEKGKTNLSATTGTIRFWFKPSWGSSTTGGNGPGTPARLFEVGAWTEKQSVGWWSLQFSQAGDAISFVAQSKGECLDILKAPIQWQAGEWHQVAFSYSPKGSWLFLDGQLAAEGQPVALVPLEKTSGVLGFSLGSGAQGANLAQGQFDEATTFKSVQSADNSAWSYSCLAGVAALGPITPEEDAARLERMVALRAARAGAGGMMLYSTMLPPPGPPPGTNESDFTGSPPLTNCPQYSLAAGGPVYLTNFAWGGSNICFSIAGGSTNELYDLFVCTNLVGTNISDTNMVWTALGQYTNCSTYLLTNQPWPNAFYVLGTPLDSDGDGLTDAYETLVHRTSTTSPDTDGDGLSDWYELNISHTNPFSAEDAPTLVGKTPCKCPVQ